MVHLKVEDKKPEEIPDLHFLNLVEENPDASIEASMFGDDNYPDKTNDEYSLVNSLNEENYHALLFIHNHILFQKGSIKPNKIIMDTGSSIDVFYNTSLMKNIHRLEKMKNIYCNSGVFNVTHMGTLTGYGLVWFKRDGIANILPMENSIKKYYISYDSSAGDKFILKKDNENLIFNRIPSGLYFHIGGACDSLMAGTTKKNCEGYTSREIAAATEARAGLSMVGNQ